ncbi:Cupredoxin [Microdochium bolleyi]|uniref:Cupredoxin n=1 Tax=Microdochium bolleyi TaxID=196109 RepID=A0A136ILT3_9PEZI|nr:Cupredoxin [Microdochium bolleyi]
MWSINLLPIFLGIAAGAKHRIDVGKGGLAFSPNETRAAVGDTLEFHFHPKAHSVARSTFDKPCEAMNVAGFYSGAFNVSSGEATSVFEVSVNSTDAMWFYCSVATHCAQGMVGVVNPSQNSTTRSLALYAAAAKSHTAPMIVPPRRFGGVLKAANGTTGGGGNGGGNGGGSGAGNSTTTRTRSAGAGATATSRGASGSATGIASITGSAAAPSATRPPVTAAAAGGLLPQGVPILVGVAAALAAAI